jgi:hypothetical protein
MFQGCVIDYFAPLIIVWYETVYEWRFYIYFRFIFFGDWFVWSIVLLRCIVIPSFFPFRREIVCESSCEELSVGVCARLSEYKEGQNSVKGKILHKNILQQGDSHILSLPIASVLDSILVCFLILNRNFISAANNVLKFLLCHPSFCSLSQIRQEDVLYEVTKFFVTFPM